MRSCCRQITENAKTIRPTGDERLEITVCSSSDAASPGSTLAPASAAAGRRFVSRGSSSRTISTPSSSRPSDPCPGSRRSSSLSEGDRVLDWTCVTTRSEATESRSAARGRFHDGASHNSTALRRVRGVTTPDRQNTRLLRNKPSLHFRRVLVSE